jgi:hypothetical protein
MFVLYWHTHFRGTILNILPYVKTMSADVGHFAWRGRYGENVLKRFTLKPVSQFKANVA